ncbi:hypothetical protein [Clostridium tagluense]|uniref:Uncharacterized protein n=1 Tax=Clostridium tagluense TaxID=360422 RepID=A0A401UUM8_9CLOT|nr:hypothetical protein [Clostridium tagluense]GCD13148.1 hypothetical protein Ctaglu_47710 [Clostridium tagluense]
MKNSTKQQQEKLFVCRLKDIQGELEYYFTDFEGNTEYTVVLRKSQDVVRIIFIDEDSKCISFTTDVIEDFTTITMEEILKQLINNIYQEQLNWRNSVIRNWKSFSAQKVKSLTLWLSRGNTDKVDVINLQLVERYKLVEQYKNDVNYYKHFVCALYYIKNNLIEEVA